MTQILMPKVGLTMTEGSIVQWHKQPGEYVRKGELLFTFETEKSTLDYESPTAGVLEKILVQAGPVVACYVPVAEIGSGEWEAGSGDSRLEMEAPSSRESHTETMRRAVSPRAKLRAKALGIDVASLQGTGPAGAVLERDVNAAQRMQPKVRATPVAARIAHELGIDLGQIKGTGRNGEITREDVERKNDVDSASSLQSPVSDAYAPLSLSLARRVTAQRMGESVRTAPHVTLTATADATALVSAREQLNAELAHKISYNALLIAIAAKALKEHPHMNASWVEPASIQLHQGIHIGLAVDTPRGLFVPVLSDVGEKSLPAIHQALSDVVTRTLAGKALPHELRGGTFTITNLGMYDIESFTPIINLPEAAILGVGQIAKRAVVLDDERIVPRAVLSLSLSFDHRVVDGAPAAKFLQRIKQLVERPMALLF